MNALEPWRQQLRADPARVVAGTLEGWLDRGPWQRAETTDFLLDLSDSDTELCELAATAVLAWARDKLSWDDCKRLRYGEIAHASQLADAFAILQRLDAPRAAYQFIEQHAWYESRTRPLRFDERLDLHRLFWLATAFRQADDRFLPRWLEHCGHAARLAPGWREWLRIGLTGLRKLNHGPLPAEQQALAGLLLFHQRACDPLPEEAASFERRQFELLEELFPRGPEYWPSVSAEVRERLPAHRELPPWMPVEGTVKPSSSRPVVERVSLEQIKRLELRISKEALSPQLWQNVIDAFNTRLNYAQRTGDSEFLVKTVSNLANRLLRRRPAPEILGELLVWVRRALDWDVSNAFLWTRLADCLRALRDNKAAEDVLWETLRRFPDNAVCRNSLAELLREGGKTEEAEALLRETMKRFPDNAVCRNSLAELLRERGGMEEAEALLRETMKRFPGDAHCRNSLAELLREGGKTEEAEALLRETMKRFPDNAVCRNSLAELLRERGGMEEAEALLRETMKRFPGDAHCRNSLAELLRDRGETVATQEAEALLRETMKRFPNDEVSRNILAKLLRDCGETEEAETLLRETVKRFPNDEVSRNILAKLLRDCGETEQAEALLRETETVHGFPNDHGMLLAPQFGIGSIRQNEWSMMPESGAGETEAFDDFPNNLPPINILPKEQVGDHGVAPDPRSAVEAFPSGGQTTTPENQVVDAEHLSDPLIPWAAERAPIIRLALGMTPTAVTHRQLLDAAQTGGAAELAEVALRLLFPEDIPPLKDALRARPGSPALRLLQAGQDAERGLLISRDAPETQNLLRTLYQTETNSEAWPSRFRAALMACADLSSPPAWATSLA